MLLAEKDLASALGCEDRCHTATSAAATAIVPKDVVPGRVSVGRGGTEATQDGRAISCPFAYGNATCFWRAGDSYWDPWCCTLPATGSYLASRCVFLKEKITVWGGTLWAQCGQETANRRRLWYWRGTWHSCVSQSGIRVLENKLCYPQPKDCR